MPVGAGSVVELPAPESLENGGSGVRSVGIGSVAEPSASASLENESRRDICGC